MVFISIGEQPPQLLPTRSSSLRILKPEVLAKLRSEVADGLVPHLLRHLRGRTVGHEAHKLCVIKSPVADRQGSGSVTVPDYRAIIELIGGRYPLKKDEHIALLTTLSTNDHGDGIRRVKYRALVRFICE